MEDWILFTKGLFPHPGDLHPRPVPECAPEFRWEVDQEHDDEQLFSGAYVFMDGSCQKHVVKELSRAGWGLAVFDSQQVLKLRAWAPLWDRFPQTPQAA
eukprot:339914-Pyramimonas_sp.AAC.1